jgi:DNA modification methylase
MTLKIENVSLDKIMPYASNAKKHPESQIQQIIGSIMQFGMNNPLLIDQDGEIIAGHGRYLAARALKLDDIPVIRLSHLSEEQKRAYRIADNKISENGGGWDEELLKLDIEELQIMMEELDITDTGFSTIEIDTMFSEKPEKNKTDEKLNSVPFIPDDEIVSKTGDLWLLGRHRLLCGSSLEESNFVRLMDGKQADIIVADPPYNLSARTIGSSGKTKHDSFKMGGGEMSMQEFTKFLHDNFTLCSRFAVPTALSYQWMDWRHCKEILSAGENAFGELVNICVWSKPIGALGKMYRSRHEFCFVFSNGDKKYIDNVALGKHGRYRTNVWEYGAVGAFGKHKNDLIYHPTVKPYEMIKDILLDASPRGGIVLDGFMSSGTTIIAAEKSKRICYGMELSPKYIDTAIRRFQDLFGIDAIRESDGKTYSELLTEKKGGQND